MGRLLHSKRVKQKLSMQSTKMNRRKRLPPVPSQKKRRRRKTVAPSRADSPKPRSVSFAEYKASKARRENPRKSVLPAPMLIHTVAAISEDVIEDFRLYLLRAAASKSSFMKAMESMQVGFKTVSQEDFIASYCSTLPP